MSYKPIDTRTGSSNADNAVVFQVGGANNGQDFDTFQFGSTAGIMDVFGSGDGVNYLTTALALIDLTSLAPATLVDETAAGKHYGIRGRWKGLRIMQKGAAAVENAYLIAHESA